MDEEKEIVPELKQSESDPSCSTIQTLNMDCLLVIFKKLDVQDLVNLGTVSKEWYDAITIFWQSYKKLILNDVEKHKNWETILKKLIKECHQYLEEVYLHKCSIKCINVLTLSLASTKQINCLNITMSNVGIDFFLRFPFIKIERLSLTKCKIEEFVKFLKKLDKYEKLDTLILRNCQFVERAVSPIWSPQLLFNFHVKKMNPPETKTSYILCSLPTMCTRANIKTLDISYIQCLSDINNFLISFKNCCQNLSTLNISGCMNVSDEGITALSSLSKLESLTMNLLPNVTDGALIYLSHLKKLSCRCCHGLTEDGVSEFIQLASNCQLFDISGIKVSDYFIRSAIRATAVRTNDLVLHLYVSNLNAYDTALERSLLLKVLQNKPHLKCKIAHAE